MFPHYQPPPPTTVAEKIRACPRERIVQILEDAGIQCYDSETKTVLDEALKVNIEDGTIPEEILNEE